MTMLQRYRMDRTLSWLLLLVLAAAIVPHSICAQQVGTDAAGFHLDVRGRDLQEALNVLVDESEIYLAYDPGLLSGKRSSCEITTASIDDAFTCVLAGTGLTYRRLDSGGFVIVKAETAGTKYTVSGFIQDASSGERFIGANVYAPASRLGTATNAYGFYSVTLPADSVTLVFTYLGYQPVTETLKLEKDVRLDVALEPVTVSAEEVVVSAERGEPIEARTQMSSVDIPIRQVRSIPTIIGETDLIKALQLMPGVRSGSEGTSGLFVRGGSPDQTLILLDGATVYNVSHFFGLFSVFNADAVRHARLIKGGFPARYGGRLSSVLDVGMKEGNLKRIGGEFAIGAAATRLLVEGPIVKDRTSFVVSGRRTYIDGLIRPFQPDDEHLGIYFYDLNAKINHKLTERDRIYVSLYRGSDRFATEERKPSTQSGGAIQWGNLTSTARYNRVLGNKLFANFMATYTNYRFDVQVEEDDLFDTEDSFKLAYMSGVRDLSFGTDLDYLPSPDHYVRSGMSVTRHTFSPGATQIRVSLDEQVDGAVDIVPAPKVRSWEYAAYLEDDVRVTERLRLNLGVHASAYQVEGDAFSSVEPRVSARYLLPNGWGLKLSYATMKQYILLLTNSSVGLPTDLWLPVTSRVPPQTSQLAALGLSTSLLDRRAEISVEGYFKKMDGLIEYKNGANFLGIDQDWQDKIEFGEGRSYGVELLLQKKAGRTSGWVAYTLSWTDRKFANLNNGRRFPFRYDGRHDFSIVLLHQITPGIELSANWVYTTGNAITLPTTVYHINPDVDTRNCIDCSVESFDKRGNYRQAPHHRLDLAVNFHKDSERGRVQTVSVGAYNAYNRKNPFFVFWEGDGNLKRFTLFPIIPYVTYRRSF